MDKEKPRLARLTAILTQLQSASLVTAAQLAQKHKVSVRTIYRDIRTLEKSGIPIVTKEGRGYSIMEGYKLPPVMFTEEEANALITAEQIIKQSKDSSFSKVYSEAILKIKSVLKSSEKQRTELLSQKTEIRINWKNEKSSDYLIDIQKALTHYQVILLKYSTEENNKTERRVEPFALVHTQDNWVLIAYCRLRKDFRAFRLDRIEYLAMQHEIFTPHDLTLQQYYEKYFSLEPTPDTPLTKSANTLVLNKNSKPMNKVKVAPFKVIGITLRTDNGRGNAEKDIPALWEKFMGEGIQAKIPNKISPEIFSIYTNYESDHTKPYDVILGCKVSSLDTIPEGMIGQEVKGGTYTKKVAKGDLSKGVVINTWFSIWQSDLNRSYTADYEVYDQRSLDPTNAEVDILVAIND